MYNVTTLRNVITAGRRHVRLAVQSVLLALESELLALLRGREGQSLPFALWPRSRFAHAPTPVSDMNTEITLSSYPRLRMSTHSSSSAWHYLIVCV